MKCLTRIRNYATSMAAVLGRVISGAEMTDVSQAQIGPGETPSNTARVATKRASDMAPPSGDETETTDMETLDGTGETIRDRN